MKLETVHFEIDYFQLGKFTGLRCAVLVGGDLIEEQFAAIHENPDM